VREASGTSFAKLRSAEPQAGACPPRSRVPPTWHGAAIDGGGGGFVASGRVSEKSEASKQGLALHWRIFVAMVLGVWLGLILRLLAARGAVAQATLSGIAGLGQSVGRMFLALLSMVVVPLVFASLVSSITAFRGRSSLKRLGGLTMAYYVTTSLFAIVVGILVSNFVRPGAGVDYNELMGKARGMEQRHSLPESAAGSSVWEVVGGIVFRMIPDNVIDAASSNRNMLAVIFFALLLGYFINAAGQERAHRLGTFFEDLFEVMMKMTHGIIQLAPYGIFGYLVFISATTGWELAAALGKYMITVFVGLMFHACVTLPLLSWVLARQNPLALAKAVSPALATAFSTASSSGTLPLTLKCLNDAGMEPRITSFVLPLGATINMDGTALYEAAAVLFIAQMLGDLSLAQQFVVAFTALLASIGAAGIPHAGTVMMVIVLEAVGLPTDAVLTILAVDRVLDMLRTTVNVWSDVNAAAVVSFLTGPRTRGLAAAAAGAASAESESIQ
jgi:proton glutamate symport protein